MSELINPQAETKDYWKHFVSAGALNAWVIHNDGNVERARSQAFQLKRDRYPSIECSEVLAEQYMNGLSSFLQDIGDSNHVDAADAALSIKCDAWKLSKLGIEVDYIRNAQSKAHTQRTKLLERYSYTYQCHKVIAKLSSAALDLTQECKDRLKKLEESPNNLYQWRQFHEEFGLFVCPTITFGGAIYADRSLVSVREVVSDQQEGSSSFGRQAEFKSRPLAQNYDLKASAHSGDEQPQPLFSISRTDIQAGHWKKVGGRTPNANFKEWIQELDDLTTWRIIRRSEPTMLVDMISDVPGMEWVRDHFQPSPRPNQGLAEPTVLRSSISPHPRSHFAVESRNGKNLLLFQNSSNELELVQLGILNFLGETPVIDNQVVPGTPLAMGWYNRRLYIFFANEDHHLQDIFYDVADGYGYWQKGDLHEREIKIHQTSMLLFMSADSEAYLFFQDPDANIHVIEKKTLGWWLDPCNLHTKQPNPLQQAWVGTPLTGNFMYYGNDDYDDWRPQVALSYLSSQRKLVRETVGRRPKALRPDDLDLEDPRVPAWRDSPWINPEQESTPFAEFSMAPDNHGQWMGPRIIFRTTGDFLTMCWKSSENRTRWVLHERICQSYPGSRFHLEFPLIESKDESAFIFYLSQEAKLEMIKVDLDISERKLVFSRRPVINERCGTKTWKQLLPNYHDIRVEPSEVGAED